MDRPDRHPHSHQAQGRSAAGVLGAYALAVVSGLAAAAALTFGLFAYAFAHAGERFFTFSLPLVLLAAAAVVKLVFTWKTGLWADPLAWLWLVLAVLGLVGAVHGLSALTGVPEEFDVVPAAVPPLVLLGLALALRPVLRTGG